jgi:uncharacterized membrane protein
MKRTYHFPRLHFPVFRFALKSVPHLPLLLLGGIAQMLWRPATLIKKKRTTTSENNHTVTVENDRTTTIENEHTLHPSLTEGRSNSSLLRRIPQRLALRRSRTKQAKESNEAPKMADLIDHNIETIISLHMHSELKVSHHQRLLERMTSLLGRPTCFYLTLLTVLFWVMLNLSAPRLHLTILDPAPFAWLQGAIGLAALLMTILVLTTQNRQAKFAERRKHLDLQVNLVVEHKVSKLISLVEELRRDMPTVKNRYDEEAAAMSEAVDPQAVFLALDETLEEISKDEEMIFQSSIFISERTIETPSEEAAPPSNEP